MGLDTSHGCWHGPYSAFNRWREKIASVSIAVPLMSMEHFSDSDGVKWDLLKPDVIHILLDHSDCDGSIEWKYTKPLADRLTELLQKLDIVSYREKTQEFIDGLMCAHEAHEDVEFH